MSSDIVFFYKAAPFNGEPWRLDLEDTCVQQKKIFMPYPAWNTDPSLLTLTSVNVDYMRVLCSLPRIGFRSKKPAMMSKATNLIGKIERCSSGKRWAVIPRVGKGYCLVAEIPNSSRYEVWSNNSPWIGPLDADLELKGLVDPILRYRALADVAQGWNTGDWKKVAFVTFPRWFSKQLLHQSSFGEIKALRSFPTKLTTEPAAIAASCYSTPNIPPIFPNTTNQDFLLERMISRLSPASLEFLCVELLNLKSAQTSKCALWMHVGGVGDGGVDGIGFDVNGNPLEFLSVKWEISENTIIAPPGITQNVNVAYLVGTPPPPEARVSLWGPKDIAADLLSNAAKLSSSFRRLLGI